MSSLWSKSSRVVIYVKILSYIVKRDTESSDYHTTMLSFEEINSKSIPIAYVGDVEKSSPLHNKVVFLTKPEDVKTREEKRKLEECHQLITGRHETFPETNTLYDFYSEQETKHNLFCKRVAILEGKFYPLPVSQSKTSLTSRVFLSGKPGVGKSYWTGKFLELYQSVYPKNRIYLVSLKDKDESLDGIDGLTRIAPEDFAEIDYNDSLGLFRNSLLIFDDVNSAPKELKKKIITLRNHIIEVGRSYGISVVCTAHTFYGSTDTTCCINNSNIFVVFPANNKTQNLRFLKEKLQLNKQVAQNIINFKSRSVSIITYTSPITVITDKFIQVLDE